MSSTKTILPRNAVIEALYTADLDEDALYEGYSGRAMYGDTCFGIVSHSGGEATTFTAVLALELGEVPRWLKNARTDNMGLSMITYWPGVEVEEE